MKRNNYLAVLGLAVLGVVAVTSTLAQMSPVFWDDDEAVSEVATYGEAAVSVEGEVRTVTPTGSPRLWGRGRPGVIRHGKLGDLGEELCVNGEIRFGLSAITVEWGAAADACPAGTWVCTWAERGLSDCNTLRNDSIHDAFRCHGDSIDYAQNNHHGWLADAMNDSGGHVSSEIGGTNGEFTPCYSLPVWCCSEVP